MREEIVNKYLKIFLAILFVAVAVIPLFHKLDLSHIKMWDEARYAVNALNMSWGDNPLIVKCNGEPDYFNTKPPLAIWIFSASMELFGYNELAMRIPSALAALLMLVVLLIFSHRVLGNVLPGVFASLALVSTTGLLRFHGARTGDVDALLTLFILTYTLTYFAILIKKKNTTKLWVIFTTALVFAFYTKGIAALIPLPGLLICTFLYNRFPFVLRTKKLYIAIGAFLFLGIGYYAARIYFDPGYLDAILKQDLGMYTSNSTFKKREFLYYYNQIAQTRFYPYAVFLPLALILSFYTKNENLRRLIIYSSIFTVSFTLIHSFSTTANAWYIIPVYPFLAIIFGGGLYIGIELILPGLKKLNPNLRIGIIALAVALIFAQPYYNTIISFKMPKRMYHLEREGAYMRNLKLRKPHLKKYFVNYTEIHPDQVSFYQTAYNHDYGYEISLNRGYDYEVGDTVLTCQRKTQREITKRYRVKVMDKRKACRLYKILERKD